MKITKLVHSCMLVEKDGKKALVDPGNFSWNSGIVNRDALNDITYICITHIHPDHVSDEFVGLLHELSPNAKWYSTSEVVAKLSVLGVSAHTASELTDVQFIESHHADLDPWNTQPEHTSFLLFDELLVSGDCQSHTSMHGARILAGPINGGPWGAVVGELKMIQGLSTKPEVFIPLHDWHWNDAARQAIYTQLPAVMAKLGVTFIAAIDGESFDV